jgi:hypothetical protein
MTCRTGSGMSGDECRFSRQINQVAHGLPESATVDQPHSIRLLDLCMIDQSSTMDAMVIYIDTD